MHFEWDPDKAASNLTKHKVDFETAKKTFSDPSRIERYKGRGGEDRYFMIAAAGDQLLAVAYTERESEDSDPPIIRLISARKATKRERKTYKAQR
jgi:uncharacterized protein